MSKLCNDFCMLVQPKKTRCICLKLFKHWSEPIFKIEAYHPYRQSFEIILSIFIMLQLLWLPFCDIYRKIKYMYHGQKQGQITPNIENKCMLKNPFIWSPSVQRLQIKCYF